LITPRQEESSPEEYSIDELKKKNFTSKEVFLLWLEGAIGYA